MSDPPRHRVVVTGIGAVTPLGSTIPLFWERLVAGTSGVRPIRRFDASRFPTTFAAEVSDSDHDGSGRLSRKDWFGWVAASQALADAGLDGAAGGARIGIAIGTERRCQDLLERIARRAIYDDDGDHVRESPFALAAALAADRRFEGPQLTIAAACASSTQAIGLAFQKIQWGDADVMLAGGCDSLVDPVMLTAFGRLGALSTRNADPAAASRPFDLHRDGFVLGEGAGMLVLERHDHAVARGHRIYAEVLGYGASSNAYRVTDLPADGQGLYLSMKWALEDAGLVPADVQYINAHGTSTLQNDRSETAAIKRCFGDRASQIPVTATKSMIGHLVCAGGAVELIVTILTLMHGVITPTINYEVPDPECDLDYVPNAARRARVDTALSNSSGFGGVNASVLVGRPRP